MTTKIICNKECKSRTDWDTCSREEITITTKGCDRYEKKPKVRTPATAGKIVDGVLIKFEYTNHCIFKMTNSLSITVDDINKCDKVRVHLSHLNTIVEATVSDIKKYRDIKEFKGETKYYYPCRLWTVLKGNKDWYEKWEEY